MTKDAILDNYKRVLSQQRFALEGLFSSSVSAIEKSNQRPRLGDWSKDIVQAFHESAVTAYASQIYAGCLFLVLDRWIQSLARDFELNVEERLDAGELIGKAPLSRLIWATANNFRHYKEWNQKNTNSQSSMQALNKAGIPDDYLKDICAMDVLILIKPTTYANLEEKVLDIADKLRAKS